MCEVERGPTGWEQAFTRAMLEHTADVITVLDAEGKVLYESPSVERVLGYTVQERLGTNVFASIHPDDLPRVREAFARRLSDPEGPQTNRFRFRHRDGSWRVVECTGRNRLTDPAVRGLVMSSRDVTDRAEAERIRQAQAAAMMASMDGIAVLDEQGLYHSVNHAYAEICGCRSPDEMVGRSWRMLYDEPELARMEEEVMPALARDGRWRGEATGRRVDGALFPQEISLSLLAGGGIVCVARDITDRVRAERELRGSEERFRTVVEALGEGIVISGRDDRVVYCNSRYAEMVGFRADEVLGRRPEDFLFPEDAPRLAEVRARRALGAGSAYEIRQRRADGSAIWVRVHGSPFNGPDGSFAGTVAVMTDVTERRRTEEALRGQAETIERQREYLRAVIDASPSLIFAKDREGRFTMANQGLAQVYGTTPENLIGRTDLDFSPDREMVESYLAADREVIDTGRSLVIPEETVTNPVTGEVRWLHTRKVRFLPPDGGPPQVLGQAMDITERKRAEDALQHSRRQLAEAQRLARLGSWDYDLVTDLAGYSEEAYRIIGLDPSQVVTLEAFMSVVHPEDRAQLERAQALAIERPEPTDADFRVVLPDGTVRYVTSSLEREVDDAGRPRRLFGYVQDVTERRLAELELRRSQQQLAQTQRMARLGSWEHDFTTDTAAWSEENYRIFEREPGTPAPPMDEFLAMAHPEDRQWLIDNATAAIATGEQQEGEFRVILPSGKVRHLWSSNQVEYDASGAPRRMFGHTQDVTERKEVELELRRSQQKLAQTQRMARLGSWEHDFTTGTGTWSEENCRIFGCDPAEGAPGREVFLAMVHPDDRTWLAETTALAIQSGEQHDGEYRIVLPSGEIRHLWSSIQVQYDGHGAPRRMFGHTQDITARKEAEQVLRRSQEQLAQAQRMARLGSWEHDLATDTSSWSEEGCRIFGLDPAGGPISPARFLELLHPDDREWLARNTAAALATGEQLEGEFRVLHASGDVRYVWSSVQVEFDSGGAPRRMYGHVQDITERKLAELELRRSQHQLAQTQHLARLGSWEHDFSTGTGTWSDAGYRIFGLDPAQGVASSDEFFARVHPGDVDRIVETNARALAERAVLNVPFRIISPEGEVRHVNSSVQGEYDEAGRPVRMFGFVQDVTRQKLAEMELLRAKEAAEAANRAKSEFLSSMSHELRTPLNSVIGFANVLLRKRGGMGEQELKYLERIQANGKHLLGLINDILDLSKIEAGKMELESRPVAPGELVAETLAELAGAVRGKEVELRAVVPEGVDTIETDPLKLKQVLINLVGNAVKFTERGQVTVTVVADPRTRRPLRLDVRDTGVGIPSDRLAAIFQAFEQAESGIARRFGGTGLGLTISRSLCELMGHRLEVESEQGVGSTFSVVLGGGGESAAAPPAARTDRREAARSTAEEEGDFHGRTVLIIDDETDARTLLTHNLEELGCQTLGASSGVQGLRMAREFRPDLILLDLLMPGMNGWEILRTLKADEELQDIPVVIVSVLAQEARASLLGAVDLMEKPFEVEQLRRVLDRHLAPRESGRVLVVQPDPAAWPHLVRCLEAEGLQARSAASAGEAQRLLEEAPADLVVLNLPAGETDPVALLRQLRTSPAHRHVPLVIVAPRDLPPHECRRLERLADVVLPRSELLDAILPQTIRRAWRRRPAGLPAAAGPARPAA